MSDVVMENKPVHPVHFHGKYVYQIPCEFCARDARYQVDHGPKPTPEDRRLLMLYGISKAEKAKILEWQGGVCSICRRPPVNIALGTDHDHKTGETRGLVCKNCNKALALLRDDPEACRRASLHLTLPPAKSALGYQPIGRPGRSTRKWRTKTERRDRMAWVKERIKQLWPSGN